MFFQTLLDSKELNPHSLARKLKNPALQSTLQRVLEGKTREPRRSTFEPVAEYFRVSVDGFFSPEIAMQELKRLGLISGGESDQQASPTDQSVNSHKVSTVHSYAKENGPNLTIRQFDTGGSMGSGVVLQDQPGVIQSMEVSQEWVQKNIRNFSSVSNLAIVTGFGDSMKPLFNGGDPLLVDRAITKVKFEAIYFFRVGDEGFVKRLQRIPGQGILVISENTAYRDWTITESMDFEVFARVVKVWCGEDF